MTALKFDIQGAAPVESVCEVYQRVLAGVDPYIANELHLGTLSLSRTVRRAAACSHDPLAPAAAAGRWLLKRFGRADQTIQRAAVAALALVLRPDGARLPADILALYPAMHGRLAKFISGPRAYDGDLFAKDLCLAAGVAAPIGSLSLVIPPPGALIGLSARTRRVLGGSLRFARQHGAGSAMRWLRRAALRPWAELHVDVRNLQEFNADGFIRSYHRLAALMEARPDIAGVYAASWLYDPALALISPNLAFVRETAEAGGGRLIRLPTDPVQTAYAVARSPTRRALWESGAYRPACYGLYWDRAALIAWSRGQKRRGALQRTWRHRPFDVILLPQ